MARVSTYLNFPGNTEKAFLFYKQVFGTEFHGNGMQRFGDVTLPEGMPPLSEEDKKTDHSCGITDPWRSYSYGH